MGSYYKDPEYPIWIVLSESHFSVLFSKSRVALNPGEQVFDLYYYDGLNNQEEEIRLTVGKVHCRADNTHFMMVDKK